MWAVIILSILHDESTGLRILMTLSQFYQQKQKPYPFTYISEYYIFSNSLIHFQIHIYWPLVVCHTTVLEAKNTK